MTDQIANTKTVFAEERDTSISWARRKDITIMGDKNDRRYYDLITEAEFDEWTHLSQRFKDGQ